MKRGITLTLVLLFLLASLGQSFGKDTTPLMHLYEPADPSWVTPVAQPKIPAPPTDKGLIKNRRLRKTAPLKFFSNEALATEAAKPDGLVEGKGTERQPYLIRDLSIQGITTEHGIDLRNITAPLIIENVQIAGKPIDERTPAEANGILLENCKDVVIRHCEVSNCAGISGSDAVGILFADNYVFSTDVGIYTTRGSDCIARDNYVRDSQRYGIFLYHGPRHIIEDNYVAWSQREGIGTNGNGSNAIYRNNVILHSGWTAINVEGGENNDSLVEDNLVVDTYYGVILEGDRVVCRKNKVYNSSQAGIIFMALGDKHSLLIEDNLIVCSGSTGIDMYATARGSIRDSIIRRNRIEQSGTAIRLEGKNMRVEDNDIFRFFNGIELTKASINPVVTGNKIYRGRNAIMAPGAESPVVKKNSLRYLLEGIRASSSKGGLFEENDLFESGQNITLIDSQEWILRKNVMDGIPYVGISMRNCTKVTAEDNTLRAGTCSAISLDGGSGNIFTNNVISSVKGLWDTAAIYLSGTKDNIFTGNTIKDSAFAVGFVGKENTGNVFKDTKYINNKKNIVMQQGAMDVDKTNTVEEKPTAK